MSWVIKCANEYVEGSSKCWVNKRITQIYFTPDLAAAKRFDTKEQAKQFQYDYELGGSIVPG